MLVTGSLDGVIRTISVQEEATLANAASGGGLSLGSVLEGSEVHNVAVGSNSSSVPAMNSSTLLHATLTRHNYIAAVVSLPPDR